MNRTAVIHYTRLTNVFKIRFALNDYRRQRIMIIIIIICNTGFRKSWSYNSIIRHSAYVHRSGSIFSCTISVFYVISATISFDNIITIVVYIIILYKHGECDDALPHHCTAAPFNPDKTAERNFGRKNPFCARVLVCSCLSFLFRPKRKFQ